MLAQRLAVHDRVLGVVNQIVQEPPRAPMRHQPLEFQRHQDVVPSFILLADQVAGGNPDVLEKHLVGALAAHRVKRANRHTGSIDRQDQDGNTPMFGGVGVGARQKPDVGRMMGGRRLNLPPVD